MPEKERWQAKFRTWAEVDLNRVEKNFTTVRERLPSSVKILTVLKADAYGHGARQIAALLEGKADYFAVAFTDEAVALRKQGIQAPIMVLGHVPFSDYDTLIRYEITAAVPSEEDAQRLSRAAVKKKKIAKIHLVLDTGMSRIGFLPGEASLSALQRICALPGLKVEGVFSHFSTADGEDLSFAFLQKQRFENFLTALKERGISPPLKHLYNSAAILRMEPAFDMVREGILLYGLSPSKAVEPFMPPSARPAMALRTHIVHLKTLPKGIPVSYGGIYKTERETVVATVCAGYADGVPRLLSPGGEVLVHGQRVPIIGRICMDQFMMDVSTVPNVKVGDVVTIFGEDGKESITANEQAARCGSIGYELLCNVSLRVPRVYLRDGKPLSVQRRLPRK